MYTRVWREVSSAALLSFYFHCFFKFFLFFIFYFFFFKFTLLDLLGTLHVYNMYMEGSRQQHKKLTLIFVFGALARPLKLRGRLLYDSYKHFHCYKLIFYKQLASSAKENKRIIIVINQQMRVNTKNLSN